MLFYAASTGGFYDSGEHAVMPLDAKEISAESHAALMAGQLTGLRIIPDGNGLPMLAPQAPPTPEHRKLMRTKAVVRALDAKAVELGFVDMRDAVSFADEPAVPIYQAKAKALRAWRSHVWAAVETMPELNSVQLVAVLPVFEGVS